MNAEVGGAGGCTSRDSEGQNTKGQTNINATKQSGYVLYKTDPCILPAQFSDVCTVPSA
jgi:hypothetical protein